MERIPPRGFLREPEKDSRPGSHPLLQCKKNTKKLDLTQNSHISTTFLTKISTAVSERVCMLRAQDQ